MFTGGQRRVSGGSTVSCGHVPPLGHAEMLLSAQRGGDDPLGMPQVQSHLLMLVRRAGCLRNMQKVGETWLHRPQQQGGKGRLPLHQPQKKDWEIMGDMRVISSTVKELMQQVGSHLIMYTKDLDLKPFTILTNTRMERDDHTRMQDWLQGLLQQPITF